MATPIMAVPRTLRDELSPVVTVEQLQAIRLLKEHLDVLVEIAPKEWVLSKGDLATLLKISPDHSNKLWQGPLYHLTFPVGLQHRRIFLPDLLAWMKSYQGKAPDWDW